MDIDHYRSLVAKIVEANEEKDKAHETYIAAHDEWADAVNKLIALEGDVAEFLRLSYAEDSGIRLIPSSFNSVRAEMRRLRLAKEKVE